jgi:hypothetical protein
MGDVALSRMVLNANETVRGIFGSSRMLWTIPCKPPTIDCQASHEAWGKEQNVVKLRRTSPFG